MSGVTELKYKGVLTTELNSCRQFLNVRSQCNFISQIVSYDCTDKAEIQLEILEWDHENHDPLGAQVKQRKIRKSLYRSTADQWRITVPEIPNTKVMVVENGSMKKLYDAAGKIITGSVMPSLVNFRKKLAGVDTLVARFPGRQRSDGATGRWAYTTRDYKEMYSEVPDSFKWHPVLDLVNCSQDDDFYEGSVAVKGQKDRAKLNPYSVWEQVLGDTHTGPPYESDVCDYDTYGPYIRINIGGSLETTYYDELSFYQQRGRFSVKMVGGSYVRTQQVLQDLSTNSLPSVFAYSTATI